MAWRKPLSVLALAVPLVGCAADPDVWSTIAPAYENGLAASHVHIDLSALAEPARSGVAQAMAEELSNIGVTPVTQQTDPQVTSDLVLAMEIVSQQYVTIYVPETDRQGSRQVMSQERNGRSVPVVVETPGYRTGDYTYDVPVMQSRFGLVRSQSGRARTSAYETVWTANVEAVGEEDTTFAELRVESARKAVRQFGRDQVLRPATRR